MGSLLRFKIMPYKVSRMGPKVQDNAIQGLKNGAEKLTVCNCYREKQPQSEWPASIKAMQLFPMFCRNSHFLSTLWFALTFFWLCLRCET
jgi:hypothetical protein